MSGPIEYKLSRPVMSIDKEITTVTLREPTGLDMRSCGDQADVAFTHKLIARLAGITPMAVDAMAARDVIALGGIVNRDFLSPIEPGNSSTDTMNAPDGGAAALATSLN